MTEAAAPPIKVFLSYARADDVVLDVIEPFSKALKHLAFADCGRNIDIFIDRESIGWGEEWEDKIRTSVLGATVFMPIITRQYFERSACREELLRFHEAASRFNVLSLLLPVVVMGHDYITADNPDKLVQMIYQRQHKDMKEAWIEGVSSSVWRRTLVSLATDLVKAVATAEQNLISRDASTGDPDKSKSGDGDDDDAPGAADVSGALTDYTEKVTQIFLLMQEPIQKFAEILNTATKANSGQLTQEQALSLVADIAKELHPYGQDFAARAQELEYATVESDVIIRRYFGYLREVGATERLKNERESLEEVRNSSGMKSLAEFSEEVNNFLVQMKPLEVLSAQLRRSIRPYRQGAMTTKNAVDVLRKWPEILDDME